MLIEYVHISAPGVTKVYDTVRALQESAEVIQDMSGELPTQEAYDAMALGRMEADEQEGIILSFKIIKES